VRCHTREWFFDDAADQALFEAINEKYERAWEQWKPGIQDPLKRAETLRIAVQSGDPDLAEFSKLFNLTPDERTFMNRVCGSDEVLRHSIVLLERHLAKPDLDPELARELRDEITETLRVWLERLR
jgi:hypothetical protein